MPFFDLVSLTSPKYPRLFTQRHSTQLAASRAQVSALRLALSDARARAASAALAAEAEEEALTNRLFRLRDD